MFHRYTLILTLILLIFILSACTPHSHYNIRQVNQEETHFKVVVFKYQSKQGAYLSVDKHIDSDDAIEFSQAFATAQQSTPVPPGTSAGEAAAASVIATVMISSINQNSQYTQAQRKVSTLNKVLNDLGGVEFLNQVAKNNFNHFSLYPIANKAEIYDYDSQLAIITIEPEVILNNDLSKLRVKTNISMHKPGVENSFYSNTFEYWSEPVRPDDSETKREHYWSDNKADNFKHYLNTGMMSILNAFESELKILTLGMDSENSYKTIRYKDDSGIHYIRGILLEKSELRFLVRDLRGNIKSLYGEVL